MEELKLSLGLKLLLVSVCIGPMLGLFIYINYDGIINPKSPQEIFLGLRLPIECTGKVDAIYRQKKNHNVMILKTNNCEFKVDAGWESRFAVGDSISKKYGEPTLDHYRNGKLIEVLDYRDLHIR